MNVRSVNPSPQATEAAWSAATKRVQHYLQAHRMTQSAQVSRLAADVIAIARVRCQPGVDPTAAAMETLEACMTSWFSQCLPREEKQFAHAVHRGRVALAVGNVPKHWPVHFLREGAVSDELTRAMRGTGLRGGPAIRLSHMAHVQSVGRRNQGDAWYSRPFSWVAGVLQRLIATVGAAFAGGR